MKKIRGLRLPVMLGVVLMSQHIHATNDLTFKGKLIIPAHTIQNAEVNWGDIGIQNLIQSDRNQKGFIVDINCPYNPGTMRVIITSNGQIGNSILMSDTSTVSGGGLPIYLYNSSNSGTGNAVTLGSQSTSGKVTGITPVRKTILHTELGCKGDIQSLRAGIFSATTVLVALYSQQYQLRHVNSISRKIECFLCRSPEGG